MNPASWPKLAQHRVWCPRSSRRELLALKHKTIVMRTCATTPADQQGTHQVLESSDRDNLAQCDLLRSFGRISRVVRDECLRTSMLEMLLVAAALVPVMMHCGTADQMHLIPKSLKLGSPSALDACMVACFALLRAICHRRHVLLESPLSSTLRNACRHFNCM